MVCDEAAEYISALCDVETIPPAAAQHIGICQDCQARLNDYLAMGVELRRRASLHLTDSVPSRSWTKPQNRVATWLQKGFATMRIPRLAFAGMVAGILVLASALTINKGRAQNTGTVVLLSTAGPNGPLADCPLSTEEKNGATCFWSGKIGSQFVAYEVRLLSRDGGRVLLAVYTRTFTPGENLGPFVREFGPGIEIWLEPGQPSSVEVPSVGTLTLTGEWLDHMPILGLLDPGPDELRFSTPLLVRDGTVVGDLSSKIGGIFSQDDSDRAMAFYIPREGRFLISRLQMKGAVEARVTLGRITFEEGGHSWQLVNGVPVCRADHLWVLHQPNFKSYDVGVSNPKLIQAEPGVWVPKDMPK